jgi:hypothetical protein
VTADFHDAKPFSHVDQLFGNSLKLPREIAVDYLARDELAHT